MAKSTSESSSAVQAEKQTKAAAGKRKITIELTEKQMKLFESQYKKLNPADAAELIFTLSKKQTSKLKIAGYSYHGNTCCV
ncbi:MAG: hypothetical protein JWN83_2050 [Chitinophagaceae bacterium]|nr:hypothetical protein [Chitinophagaceae bacterium]